MQTEEPVWNLWLPSDMSVIVEARDVDLVPLYVGTDPDLRLQRTSSRDVDPARYSSKGRFEIRENRLQESTYLEDR